MSRDELLNVGMGANLSLFLGTMGQAACTGALKPHLPGWIMFLVVCLPFLTVFTITFFKRSFLTPRAFRFCLLFAMCWFALVTFVAEILFQLGFMPPESPTFGRTLSRILMHVGWLSFIPLIRLYLVTRRFEAKGYELRINKTLHTEPRAARFLKSMSFAAARRSMALSD